MHQLLSSIELSLEKGNWFGALFIAISLPDICGATEDVVKGNGARYKEWFNRYLKPRYDPENMYEQMLIVSPEMLKTLSQHLKETWKKKAPLVTFTAEDCWSLRNACLHEGVDENKLKKFRITPPSGEGEVHMNSFQGVLQLDVVLLCNDIINAVHQWLDDMKQKPDVMAKIEKMIKIDQNTFDSMFHFENYKSSK
ncbi:TPA: hypothetical protein ACTW0H_001333 [Raoultella ornithinolytica]